MNCHTVRALVELFGQTRSNSTPTPRPPWTGISTLALHAGNGDAPIARSTPFLHRR